MLYYTSMHTYTPQHFTLPSLSGISEKQVTVHLGLYEGYVKHVNVLREQIADLSTLDAEKYAYAIMETRRRLGFEFDGMRMHEYFFRQFEGGHSVLDTQSPLANALVEKYGSVDAFIAHFTQVGMTRGIGWSVLYADPLHNTLHTAWVADHELGGLSGLPIILAMDMWEHAFMVDYLPAEKKLYIEAFLKNVHWALPERRFTATLAQ